MSKNKKRKKNLKMLIKVNKIKILFMSRSSKIRK